MDLKEPGNLLLYWARPGTSWAGFFGPTFTRKTEAGVRESNPCWAGGASMPSVVAIKRGLLSSCHDLSEGGLAVALAEMAFAGGFGAPVALAEVPRENAAESDFVLLFSESPTRFVVEVRPECSGELAALWNGLPFCRLGEVTGRTAENGNASPRLIVQGLSGSIAIDAEVAALKSAWQEPLRW